MSRILSAAAGMRVLTPRGEIARIENTTDGGDRCRLTYLNPDLGEVTMQKKLLAAYDGPPVLFPDELKRAQRRGEALARGRR